jgi:DNA-directed RNA polymerase subunit RPC12/RpoP
MGKEKKMRNLLAVILLGSALCLTGCATTDAPAQKTESAKQFIKCSTCGAEFTSSAGLTEHIKQHPDHQAAGDAKPLIKCATCGTEFTSQAGIEEHIKAHPGHEPAAIEGQFPK